jgi:hypothetical protein
LGTLKKINSNPSMLNSKQRDSLGNFKEGIAAFAKGGGDTSKLNNIIIEIDKIQTGDGSSEKHTMPVEKLKEKVIASS